MPSEGAVSSLREVIGPLGTELRPSAAGRLGWAGEFVFESRGSCSWERNGDAASLGRCRSAPCGAFGSPVPACGPFFPSRGARRRVEGLRFTALSLSLWASRFVCLV